MTIVGCSEAPKKAMENLVTRRRWALTTTLRFIYMLNNEGDLVSIFRTQKCVTKVVFLSSSFFLLLPRPLLYFWALKFLMSKSTCM